MSSSVSIHNVIPLKKERSSTSKTTRKKLRRYVRNTNDFLENYFALITGRFKEFTVDQFEDFLIGLAREFVSEIYEPGARKISFSGLGAIGCLPLERTTNVLRDNGCIEKYNKAARGFNVKLQAMIKELCARCRGLRLRYCPVYDGLLKIIQNPSSFGKFGPWALLVLGLLCFLNG
ncbi:uncharacterized protein A4U43_C01F1540 [Asparagus officinalis]|uniref:Uncharacterized protein n=1 Tax=Asparagus officinalis TaxID=4686 RepID=A0A5P1FQM1_ASPOF|nr:GDSL esterase/lipase At2g04570-like [Asparagus officinalis]ONK78970.1 uncharacterized protein A4U43_C01F1540 [Asparagus officinalis]